MKYKKSKYSKVYKSNKGGYNFFNSANVAFLKGDLQDKDILEMYTEPRELMDDPTSSMLLEEGFIVEEHLNEEELLVANKRKRYGKEKEKKNNIGYARISITEDCNLRCTYCFVDNVVHNKGSMSDELFTDIMTKLIQDNKGKHLLVQYFGGEPLMRMDLVKKGNEMLIDAKNDGKIDDFSQEIVSNGTLLTDDNVKFLIENRFMLSVSLDGYEEINDKSRIFSDGSGSFKKIVKGIEKFKASGGSVSIFITPNDENIDNFEEIIKYFVEELGAVEIAVNTPQPYEFGWEVSGVKLAKALQATLQYCADKNVIYSTPANNLLFLIDNNYAQSYSCMNLTYRGEENTWGVYITSNGIISNCVVDCHDKCSKDFKDFKMDEEFVDWHFKPSYLDECLNCVATNVCGGPCSIESLLTDNGLNQSKCQFVNSMMKWVLES